MNGPLCKNLFGLALFAQNSHQTMAKVKDFFFFMFPLILQTLQAFDGFYYYFKQLLNKIFAVLKHESQTLTLSESYAPMLHTHVGLSME